jgi:hypothetical protein
MLEFSYWHPGLLLIHDAGNHPPYGTFFIAYSFPGSGAIGRNNDALVHPCTMGVDSNLRDAFRIAGIVDRLANDEPPAFEAWVLSGGGQVSFYACQKHQ